MVILSRFFANIFSNTHTTSCQSSETGNTRISSSTLRGTPCSINQFRHFSGENFPNAFFINPHHRVYFVSSIFLSVIPVVTLHRPPQEMRTFFPISLFFSNILMCNAPSYVSRRVAAAIIPLAQAQIITISFMRKSIVEKNRNPKEILEKSFFVTKFRYTRLYTCIH